MGGEMLIVVLAISLKIDRKGLKDGKKSPIRVPSLCWSLRLSMTSIFKQLASEPRIVLDRLYNPGDNGGGSWACQAVFQSLPVLAQCLVMRLLWLEASVSGKELRLIFSNALPSTIRQAVDELLALWVLLEESTSEEAEEVEIVEESKQIDERKKYALNPQFKIGMKACIVQPQEPWSSVFSKAQTESRLPSRTDLDAHSRECWNRVLSMLVNLNPQQYGIPAKIIEYVLRSGLMTSGLDERGGRRYLITSKGYEFMLKDYTHQVWDYVMDTLCHTSSREECYSLLFQLAYCQYGKCYPMSALTKTQQQIVFEFSQLGIMYMSNKTSASFYPCQIALTLLFPQQVSQQVAQPEDLATVAQLQIIVETNLQVVAYASSDLHLAMLKLFVDINMRMPNMAMGRITREKSREAFRAGISAAQIIDFLTLHAHAVVSKKQSVAIPENVSDQLVLWEAETKRMQCTDAVVADFREMVSMSRPLFNTLVQNLSTAKLLLWCHAERMMFACKPEAQASIQDFLMKHIYYS